MAAALHDISYAKDGLIDGLWRKMLYDRVEKLMAKKISENLDDKLEEKMGKVLLLIVNSKSMRKKDSQIRFQTIKDGLKIFQETFFKNGDHVFGDWEINLIEAIKGLIYAHYAYLSKI